MKDEPRSSRGRPPLVAGQKTTPVSVRVPTPQFERVCQRAAAMGVPVPELVRRGLDRVLDDDEE